MSCPPRGGVTCALALVAAIPCSAAEPLTLQRFQDLLRARDPMVLRAATDAREARGARAGATPLFRHNPTISATAGPVAQPTGLHPRTWEVGGQGTVGFSVPVEIGGQRGLRVAAADALVAAREQAGSDAVRRSVAAGTEAFLRAVHAARVAALGAEAHALAIRTRESVTAAQRAGMATALDVELAAMDVSEAANHAAAAAAQAEGARGAVLAWVGVDPDDAGPLEDDGAGAVRDVPSLEECLRSAEQRADVRALRLEGTAARTEARVAATGALPTPVLGASYQYQYQFPAPQHAVVAQVGFELPVFSRGQGEEGRARARAAGLSEEEHRAQERARAEVRAAYAVVARIRALRAATPPVTGSGPAADALERAYQQRTVDLATLLAVRRRGLQAREAALELDLQESLARAWLDAAAGRTP